MHSCFGWGILAFAVYGAQAAGTEAPARRASIVRVDAHSGRLVRGMVVMARVVPPKLVSALAPPTPAASIPSPAAAGGNVNDIVERIARRHEVEPLLVDSMIRVESNYNVHAISPKGAEGLMQLIPSTARRFGVSNSFHPVENIEGGVRYLKYLMQMFKGDERLALAAYNAGEGAVVRYNGIPPYPETRNYVYQVGKRLGAARESATKKSEAAKSETASAPRAPVIEKTVDADGKEYYRAR